MGTEGERYTTLAARSPYAARTLETPVGGFLRRVSITPNTGRGLPA